MRNVTKLNKVLAAALALVLLVGTMAYFTDRVTGQATITTIADAVNIEPDPDPNIQPDDPTKPPFVDPTPDNPDNDLTEWWAYLNSKAMANFNPGDKMNLSYILTNEGALGVDIRETFVITSGKEMNASDPEFALFTGVEKDAYGGYAGTGAVTKADGSSATQYKYVIEDTMLSGSDETIDGHTAKQQSKTYYVVFDADAKNAFMGVKCTVDYIVEAKQHGDDGWVTIEKQTIDLTGGGTIEVVPAA